VLDSLPFELSTAAAFLAAIAASYFTILSAFLASAFDLAAI